MTLNSASGLLRSLVGIPSVNPTLTEDPALQGEARLVDWLEPWFQQKGFRTQRVESTPGRPNLIARFGPETPARTLLLESHLDTVGVGGFAGDPFVLREEAGRLYGRGACDTKGPLAAFMAALELDVLEVLAGSRMQLVWLGAIGEETGNLGAEEALAAGLRADECVVLEPTDMRIVHAHKGVCWFKVATRGRAAHASHPASGDNAILKMSAVWRILEEEAAEAATAFRSASLGAPTVSVGTIRGGAAANVVPDRCEIQVDRRLMPGETAAGVLDSLRTRLAEIPGGADVELIKDGPGFQTAAEAALPRRLGAALESAGAAPALEGAAWCSDAGVLADACSQTVVWGPGSIAQAHTTDEFIEADMLESGRRVLHRFLMDSAAETNPDDTEVVPPEPPSTASGGSGFVPTG